MEELIARVSQDQYRQPIKRPLPVNQLHKRATYEELIDFIETDPYKIKYPDREAKILRNSFQLSFLDKFGTETLQKQQENLLKYQIAKAEIAKRAVENGTSVVLEAGQYGNIFQSAESTPAKTAESGPSPVPAEMPDKKPPPDDQPAKETVGGSSSSASGQIIAGKAYPPSGPPPPKAKATTTPPKQESPSPLIGVDSPGDPITFMSKGVYGAIDAVSNLFNYSTPSPQRGSGVTYEQQSPPSYNTRRELWAEQQRQMKERQQRILGQKSTSAASMAKQHLEEVSQQNKFTISPTRIGAKILSRIL